MSIWVAVAISIGAVLIAEAISRAGREIGFSLREIANAIRLAKTKDSD